jgi:hypothetical protein
MADIAKTNGVKNGNVTFLPVAIAASQTIPVSKDERMCIYIKNSQAGAASVITIPKGNGIAGVADLVVSVPQSSEMLIGPLESAKYVDKSTGKITVNSSTTTTTTIAVIQL